MVVICPGASEYGDAIWHKVEIDYDEMATIEEKSASDMTTGAGIGRIWGHSGVGENLTQGIT